LTIRKKLLKLSIHKQSMLGHLFIITVTGDHRRQNQILKTRQLVSTCWCGKIFALVNEKKINSNLSILLIILKRVNYGY
jgi:hypothetical protein